MTAPERIIAAANATLAGAEANPEAILSAIIDALVEARPAIWMGSLTTNDPSVMRVIGQAGSHPLIAHYLAALRRRGGLSSAPVAARVIESGEPLLLPTIQLPDFVEQYFVDIPVPEHEYLPQPGALTALVVLMRAGRAVVGTLGMYVAASGDKIREDDVGWVQVIADLTGMAIENARLLQEAKSRLEMVTALDDGVHALTSSHDLSFVLTIVVNRITSIMRVDACDVLLVNEADVTFELAESAGFRWTTIQGMRLSIDNALLRQALDSQRIEYLRSASVLDQASRRTMFMREGFVAYAAYPIIWRGNLLGAFEIFHRSDLSLDGEASAFITCLAAVSAVAVEVLNPHGPVRAEVLARKSGDSLNLSPTGWQVLRLVIEGRTNHEIAAELHLSAHTIKFHVRKILNESGCVNRTDLARRATREGWA